MKQRLRVRCRLHLPCLQDNQPLGVGYDFFQVMGGDHDGMALMMKPDELLQGLLDPGVVQIGKRLVEEDDARLHRQYPGDRHTALFASGKPMAEFIRHTLKFQGAQRRSNARGHLGARQSQFSGPKATSSATVSPTI